MGRYWNTETGRYGKFAFGEQKTTDPEIFGMERDDSVIYYVMDCSDADKVKAELKKQYDILKVPEKERIWYINDSKTDTGRYWDYAFKEDENGGYWNPIAKRCESERFKGANLALCRIGLGLAILTDLEAEGFCSLKAEC